MLDLRPLSDGFGLEAHGVNLAEPLDEAAFADVAHAFFRAQVLVVRGQRLSPAQSLRLRGASDHRSRM